jgi:reverse transcriptase-like protein
LSHALASLRFCITKADPGVFYIHMDEHVLVLAVHVDDCIFTGSSKELIALYKQKLNDCYALTDLGPVHWLLGIKVMRD